MVLVRPSARAQTRLAYKTCLRTPQREDAAPTSPEALRQFTRTEPSPEGVWGLCDVAPGVRRRTNAKRVRCADAPTRQHGRRRTLFARALASQRPPSRERPSLGGGGPGRAPSPSLCVSPFSRSIDDTEHRRRPVRGPPASSSAGTSLRAPRRRRPRQHTYKESHLPAFPRLVDDPRAVGPKGPWRRSGAATPSSRTLCYGAASLGEVRQGRSQCSHVQHGPRPGPSTTPQETGFERHELKSCVGGAKS